MQAAASEEVAKAAMLELQQLGGDFPTGSSDDAAFVDEWFQRRSSATKACVLAFQKHVETLKAAVDVTVEFFTAVGEPGGHGDCPAQRVAVLDFQHQLLSAHEAASGRVYALATALSKVDAE